MRPQTSESVFYRLDEDGIKPVFKVDFGSKAMPARYYYDSAGEDMGAYMLSDYYKLPMDFRDTRKYVYCRFCGDQASECSLVYSRRTGKCIAWKNTNEDGGFRVVGSDKDCFILIASYSEGRYGPFGTAVRSFLSDNYKEGQRLIVRVKFDF